MRGISFETLSLSFSVNGPRLMGESDFRFYVLQIYVLLKGNGFGLTLPARSCMGGW